MGFLGGWKENLGIYAVEIEKRYLKSTPAQTIDRPRGKIPCNVYGEFSILKGSYGIKNI